MNFRCSNDPDFLPKKRNCIAIQMMALNYMRSIWSQPLLCPCAWLPTSSLISIWFIQHLSTGCFQWLLSMKKTTGFAPHDLATLHLQSEAKKHYNHMKEYFESTLQNKPRQQSAAPWFGQLFHINPMVRGSFPWCIVSSIAKFCKLSVDWAIVLEIWCELFGTLTMIAHSSFTITKMGASAPLLRVTPWLDQ